MVDKQIIERTWTNFTKRFEWNGKMTIQDFIDANVDRLEFMYIEWSTLERNEDEREGRRWTEDYDQYMIDTAIDIMKRRYDLFLEDN